MKKLMEINIYFYLFILIIIFVFFLSLDVNALQNYDTQYNITIPNYDELYEDVYCGNESIKDFLHNFIDTYNESNSLYNIIILPKVRIGFTSYNDNRITFFTYKKSNTNTNQLSFYGGANGYFYNDYLWNTTGVLDSYSYEIKLDTCDSDISTSTSFQKYLDYLYGNYTPSNYGQINDEDNQGFLKAGGWILRGYKLEYDEEQSFNNVDSFTLNNVNWYYWTNRALKYQSYDNSIYNSQYVFFKKFHINNNDTTYNYLYDLVSYYDIKDTFPNNSSSSLIDYQNSFGTLYLNFTPQEIPNFDVKLDFDVDNSITSFDYGLNTSYEFSCYGRVNNNNNYYSYEDIGCTFDQNNTFDNTQHGQFRFENIEFFDSNDNLITDFSRYDKLFVYFDFNYYNDNIPKSVSNFSITTNLKNLYTKHFQGSIYDNFDNLPLLFKMFISSNNKVEYSYFSIKKSNNFTLTDRYFLNIQQYNTSNLNPIGSVRYISNDYFQDFQVSNSNNLGYMVFQQIDVNNDGSSLNNIEMTFNKNIIISINNAYSNNLYYYDDTNTIVNDNIQPNYDTPSSNNYDLSYYFSIVNDYIEDASDKVVQFNTLTQDFYDSMPIFFKLTIYVLFILFCSYFLFREIRR